MGGVNRCPHPDLPAPIDVVDYDPAWPARFEREAARIREALGSGCTWIEHVGSTAVPGMPGKPVIDLMMSLDRELTPAVRRVLAGLGYVRLRARHDGRLVFRRGAPRSHSLHVAALGSPAWDAAVGLRDRLRADAGAAGRYAEVKRAAARAGRPAYSRAKAAFIREVRA